MKVNQFEEIPAIKELDDELAATCSGGVHYVGGNNPDIILYRNELNQGEYLKVNASVNDGLSNLRNYGDWLGFTFNDSISSFEILRGQWNFYADANYNGLYNSRPLGPGKYSTLPGTFSNDSLSSLKRVG